MDPRELRRRLELAEHEADEIAAARLRPGEAAEIRARLERGPARRDDRPRARATVRGDARWARGAGARERDRRSALREAAVAGPARRALRGARGPARGPRGGARGRRRPRSRRSPRPSTTTRRRSRALEERLSRSTRLRAPLRRRRGGGHRARRAVGRGGRAAARPRGRARPARGRGRAAARARSRTRPRRCRAARGRRRPGSPARSRRSSRRSGSRRTRSTSRSAGGPRTRDEPAVELDGDAVAFDATGIDDGRLPVRAERRRAGPAARPDRVGRRAVAGSRSRSSRSSPRSTQTPTLVFDEIDTGIGGRSADPVGRSLWTLARAPPGAVRDPPAPDRGPRRRPLPDREARARRPDRDRGRAARPRRARSRSSPDARRRGGRRGEAALGSRAARAARPRRGVAARGRARGRIRGVTGGGGLGADLRRGDRGLPRPTCGSSAACRRRRCAPTAATSRDFADEPRRGGDVGGRGPTSPRRYLARADAPRPAGRARARARRASAGGRPRSAASTGSPTATA